MWESPKCLGWEIILVYRIRIETEDGVIEQFTNEHSYVFPVSVKGVVNVSLSVENYCGETAQLARQPVDTEATGTGETCLGEKLASSKRNYLATNFVQSLSFPWHD